MPHFVSSPEAVQRFPPQAVGFDGFVLRSAINALGPRPRDALASFVDLGLNDAEIARYIGSRSDVVVYLRDIWRVRVVL